MWVQLTWLVYLRLKNEQKLSWHMKLLTAKPNELRSILRTHLEGENPNSASYPLTFTCTQKN